MKSNLAEMKGNGEMGNENALKKIKVMMTSRTGEECKIVWRQKKLRK